MELFRSLCLCSSRFVGVHCATPWLGYEERQPILPGDDTIDLAQLDSDTAFYPSHAGLCRRLWCLKLHRDGRVIVAMIMRPVWSKRVLLALCTFFASVCLAVPAAQDTRPRIIVLTDIGNEPDDSESMVRFLLYTN